MSNLGHHLKGGVLTNETNRNFLHAHYMFALRCDNGFGGKV
jgi:hypothetical protein